MRVNRARTEEVLRAIVHEARAEKITFMAGSIAYHAFISILPLLLLVLTLVQRTQNVALRDSIVAIMQAVLTEEASQVIQQGLTDADASVSILGLVFLVWGALRIFRGLDTAFSDIYETERQNTFGDQLLDGLLLLATVALAIVGVSVLGNAVSVEGGGVLGTVLRGSVTAAGLFVVFYPMYYVFPDTDVTFAEIVPGTLFAAVGLTVAQALFTTFKSGGAGGNLVASILVLLTWLYIIGLVVLLGAVVNAVLSNRSRDVNLEPVVGGVEERGGDTSAGVERTVLLSDLDELADRLTEGGESVSVSVTVGDETTTVVAPQTATVDRENSVFGLDGSVALTLRWWPEDD
ncbi:YihY/virulence factor BrkB family protein [Halomicroarcula limicola]|uniref:YihY/virulence factor BrkB family protein n=1 Tax=Haloarcula limicola TaxID=1429915 RepID=A0A8J7Y1W9_9EURY|nr:YihY/virulence factor BrkB family protein [Halomicroarcula limicola]MBV0922667.1 YihY/virulence factor BrkB family protein [Halomicroarcula limicola]